MPLVHSKYFPDAGGLLVWSATESIQSLYRKAPLHKEERSTFHKLRHPVRQKQWLAARILMSMLSPSEASIGYHPSGSPFLISPGESREESISITHDGELVAVIVRPTTFLGIDLQGMDPRVHRIAERFLHPFEKEFSTGLTSTEEEAFLIAVWAIKEAVYKAVGGLPNFAWQIRTEPFDFRRAGHMYCTIHPDDQEREDVLRLRHEWLGEYFIAWTS